MKLSSKILIGGLTLAALVYAASIWNQHRLEGKLAVLVAQCEGTNTGGSATTSTPPSATPGSKFDLTTARPITADEVLAGTPDSGPWEKYKADPLVCEPENLMALAQNTGIQRQISDAYFAAQGAASDAPVVAVVIALLSAIPWLWYFLLRRIVELRNAIGGKLPHD